jgi:hypothetical protein
MPWAERSVVKLRKEFVLRALAQEIPFRELCREFGMYKSRIYPTPGSGVTRGIGYMTAAS